jgi:hypothetical protein
MSVADPQATCVVGKNPYASLPETLSENSSAWGQRHEPTIVCKMDCSGSRRRIAAISSTVIHGHANAAEIKVLASVALTAALNISVNEVLVPLGAAQQD